MSPDLGSLILVHVVCNIFHQTSFIMGARNMSPDQSALRGQSDLGPCCSQYFPPDKLYHGARNMSPDQSAPNGAV